ASATVAEPAALGRALVGHDVRAVTDDASPRRETVVALWEPPEQEDGSRRSTLSESASVLTDLVRSGVQTVAFARSRQGVEVVAARAREALEADAGSDDAPARVAAYRGGYLPEERRALESALRERSVMGLAATSALELGIDIAGLDAVVMAGWPG